MSSGFASPHPETPMSSVQDSPSQRSSSFSRQPPWEEGLSLTAVPASVLEWGGSGRMSYPAEAQGGWLSSAGEHTQEASPFCHKRCVSSLFPFAVITNTLCLKPHKLTVLEVRSPQEVSLS